MNQNNKDIPKEVQQYVDKGKEALKKHNYEYAVELFNHALTLNQELPEIRHYLHLSQIKNFQENPPSIFTKGINKARVQSFIFNAKKLESQGRIKEAIEEYEKAISIDPLNASTFNKLAYLFVKNGQEQMAINTFNETLVINPENLEALKQLGKIYQKKEEYEKAQNFFNKAKQIKPDDIDVQKGLKDLAALRTIDKGKWQEESSYREKIEDKEEAERLEKESRTIKTKQDIDFLIKNLEKEIEKEPKNASLLYKLADYYKQKEDYNKTQQIYKRILELKPEDDIAQKNIEELESKKIEKEILYLKEELKKDPENKEIQNRIKELEEKKQNLDFERIKDRVSKFPNDARLRYQYGIALKDKGRYKEAISQFQKSVEDPSKRLDSLNMLGLCFMEKKMYDLAVTQFKKALTYAPQITPKTKDIIYNLGITYEKMGKTEEAINEFKKIYEVDINYKDIADKIEKAY